MPDLIAAYGLPLLVAMAIASLVIGFSKTSFGGIAAIAVAVFALAMPAKESTATVLLLLLVGDVIAVSRYRTVSWSLLIRLIPSVLPGLALGALFMNVVDDVTMRRTIGGLLLVMVLLQLWPRRPRRTGPARGTAAAPPASGAAPAEMSPAAPHDVPRPGTAPPEVHAPGDSSPGVAPARINAPATASSGTTPPSGEAPSATPTPPPHWARAVATGVAAGFATMTANAAGPVMALYFLAARVDKARFIGTNAWFFFLVNLSKTPFTTALGLYSPTNLLLVVALIPAVLVGAVLGIWIIGRVTQRQFELVTIAASAIASLALLLR